MVYLMYNMDDGVHGYGVSRSGFGPYSGSWIYSVTHCS